MATSAQSHFPPPCQTRPDCFPFWAKQDSHLYCTTKRSCVNPYDITSIKHIKFTKLACWRQQAIFKCMTRCDVDATFPLLPMSCSRRIRQPRFNTIPIFLRETYVSVSTRMNAYFL